MLSSTDSSPQVSEWLKNLPVAPVYYPTISEFQDPLSYIHKIEAEASQYGICKIIPPLPPPLRKTTISNFNRSLSSQIPNPNPKSPPTFTTQYQQIGFCLRDPRSCEKPVWQSEETYTFQQFEAKGREFDKSIFRKSGKKGVLPLEIETLFWKADLDKPLTVECANGIPGSCFVQISSKKMREAEATTVGETAWNMRGVSKLNGSLLRFMKEEIPGVSSPMIFLGLLFSWFGWHVEDHDLHSLNYLHMGAPKTWYGVPGDAAVAFEEVVRLHGYGGDVNPLVTFSILNEKTTLMSPEVLINAGIPCCRLVQNAGEFVITFPRAYHSGFNHGFNCEETANIATAEWLRIAKEAAIRRASINCPPLLSHFQLLYALTLSLSSRIPMGIGTEPRSSRLKDKKRSEGETMVKKLFVQNVIQNNDLLHGLITQGSSCVLLPQSNSISSDLSVGSKLEKSTFSLDICSLEEETDYSNASKESTTQNDAILDQGLFKCVTCGVLSFACAAIIQPRDAASRYFASAGCSFNGFSNGSGVPDDRYSDANENTNSFELNFYSGGKEKSDQNNIYDLPIQYQSSSYQGQVLNKRVDVVSKTKTEKGISSLDLLAAVYGNSSDSEEEQAEAQMPVGANEKNLEDYSSLYNNNGSFVSAHGDISSGSYYSCDNSILHSHEPDRCDEKAQAMCHTSSSVAHANEIPDQYTHASYEKHGKGSSHLKEKSKRPMEYSLESDLASLVPLSNTVSSCRDPLFRYGRVMTRSAKTLLSEVKPEKEESAPADYSMHSTSSRALSNCSPTSDHITAKSSDVGISTRKTDFLVKQRSDEDASRKHMFCLEHAVEVEKRLQSKGGVQMLLLCHPDYPKVEAEAKLLAGELGVRYNWKNIKFKEATKEDQARMKSVLDHVEVTPGNGDWTVMLGINLCYSASLCLDPLYSKRFPYNSVIYNAFGHSFTTTAPEELTISRKEQSKRKKIVVAGRWCGKVWMSNEVHSYLAQRDTSEKETWINFCSFETQAPEVEAKPIIKKHAPTPVQNSPESATTTVNRKLGQKRKGTSVEGTVKKVKFSQLDSPIKVVEDSPRSSSPPDYRRVLRSAKKKFGISTLSSTRTKNINECESHHKEEKETASGYSLRKRTPKSSEEEKVKHVSEKQTTKSGKKKALSCNNKTKRKDEETEYTCNLDQCTMRFDSKKELVLHQRNICLVKGCHKKMFSHKYLVQHSRVHVDVRPLKCPWKGCNRTFKWAWARTEHIRVHTGARPYVCHEPGCHQTFRFVSDFSRHRRTTGHQKKDE